jgi:hypothetical protein
MGDSRVEANLNEITITKTTTQTPQSIFTPRIIINNDYATNLLGGLVEDVLKPN